MIPGNRAAPGFTPFSNMDHGVRGAPLPWVRPVMGGYITGAEVAIDGGATL